MLYLRGSHIQFHWYLAMTIKMEMHEVGSCVEGYRAFKNNWSPTVQEQTNCVREYYGSLYAMAVMHRNMLDLLGERERNHHTLGVQVLLSSDSIMTFE